MQYSSWSFRCSWSIAYRRCANYILTQNFASMHWVKTGARLDYLVSMEPKTTIRYEKHLSFGIWCGIHQRFYFMLHILLFDNGATEHNNIDNLLTLQRRNNGRDSVSNHQPHDCLLSRLFRRRSTKTSELRVTGLCAGNSPWTSEFPAQTASNAENVSIWWRHHEYTRYNCKLLLFRLICSMRNYT